MSVGELGDRARKSGDVVGEKDNFTGDNDLSGVSGVSGGEPGGLSGLPFTLLLVFPLEGASLLGDCG